MPSRAAAVFAAHLVAHQPDVLGRGADEGEAVLLDRRCEIGVLGEKSEPGMDRVGAGDRLPRTGSRPRSYSCRAPAGGPMQTVSSASRTFIAWASAVECTATVLIPISRQARWILSAISPRLAISTFSNIAAQNDHSISISTAPYSTGCASATRICAIRPARGARISFMTFIASMISKG